MRRRGAEVARSEPIDAGIYGHQVRVSPDDRLVILVTRGHEAAGSKPEEPGR
jgi:6-phosphogluconolactonase